MFVVLELVMADGGPELPEETMEAAVAQFT
jgi:hypothetical protein